MRSMQGRGGKIVELMVLVRKHYMIVFVCFCCSTTLANTKHVHSTIQCMHVYLQMV